jgi:hypothetical protein
VDVQIHTILTYALAGDKWSASRPGRFVPGKRAPGGPLELKESDQLLAPVALQTNSVVLSPQANYTD